MTAEATVNNPSGIEVIIWDGASSSFGGQLVGHVSYIIDGVSYSWQMHEENGEQVWFIKDNPSDYTDVRRKQSAGRGYVLDFGSDALNSKFKELLKRAYKGRAVMML